MSYETFSYRYSRKKVCIIQAHYPGLQDEYEKKKKNQGFLKIQNFGSKISAH